jgi:hypothetical protein
MYVCPVCPVNKDVCDGQKTLTSIWDAQTFIEIEFKELRIGRGHSFNLDLTLERGRAIAQAVSRRLHTADARVRAQVRSYGIYGGQSGTGAGFLRLRRFPLPIVIPPTGPHSSSIIRGWYNRPISGRGTKLTQSHPNPRN